MEIKFLFYKKLLICDFSACLSTVDSWKPKVFFFFLSLLKKKFLLQDHSAFASTTLLKVYDGYINTSDVGPLHVPKATYIIYLTILVCISGC